jgi:hypothetical protein
LLYKLTYATKKEKEENLELKTMVDMLCQHQFVTSTITAMSGNPNLPQNVTEAETCAELHA